jgi:hypothetical protein
MATIYRRREETARIIWDDLHTNGDSSSYAIQKRTDLSHMQFWYGLGFLKDELQTDNGQPLVWSPKRGVYSLTSDQDEWSDYLLKFRMRSIATQVRRMEQTALAGGALFGTRKKGVRMLIAGISSLRQMADAMVE